METNNQYNNSFLRHVALEFSAVVESACKPEPQSGAGNKEKSDLAGKRLSISPGSDLFVEIKEHTTLRPVEWLRSVLKSISVYEDGCVVFKKPNDLNEKAMIIMPLISFTQLLFSAKNKCKKSLEHEK